jgi:predicted nucleic acid binding AN1-type Zn finger protein
VSDDDELAAAPPRPSRANAALLCDRRWPETGRRRARRACAEVTLYFRVGQGQDSEVSQAGGAPHESFVAGRTAEVAAALGVEPSLIEAMDVKKSGKSQFKSAGVVEFCFIIRVADPSALIASLEAQLQGGGGGICASSSVPVQLRDEAARDGGIKVMERPLDASAIEQVALIVLARIAEAMPDEVLPHIPTLVKLLASMIATSVVKSDTWLAEKVCQARARVCRVCVCVCVCVCVVQRR